MHVNLRLAFVACIAGLATEFSLGARVGAPPPELDDLLDKVAQVQTDERVAPVKK